MHGGTSHNHGGAPSRRITCTLPRPTIKPRNVLPASPMKIRAGGRLNHKKPDNAPIKAKNKRHSVLLHQAIRARNPTAIQATPPDSASMLSSMLKALIRLAIHTTATTRTNHGHGGRHKKAAAKETVNWTRSRNGHGNGCRSSSNPSSKMTVPSNSG